MTTFTTTWDGSFEAQPADSENVSQGAGRIRTLKESISERLEVDHSWAGDANDGAHKKLTLIEQSADPTNAANTGFAYTKDVSGVTELFYEDSAGTVTQITQNGALALLPPATISPYAGSSAPSGWLLCYGQAVSRTTYARLFAIISTTYGAGDTTTTFNVPDLRGRVVAGVDNMGGSAASRMTNVSSGAGFNAASLGAAGGSQSNTLTTAEMPAHAHTITDPGHSHGKGIDELIGGGSLSGYSSSVQASTASATTGITINNTGGGGAHANVQPTMVLNYIIKT